MSKVDYKETKSLPKQWLALSAPTLAILGLLSESGGGCIKEPKGLTDIMKRKDVEIP